MNDALPTLRPHRRRPLVAAAAVLLAVAAAGCGGGARDLTGHVAARVGDTELSYDDARQVVRDTEGYLPGEVEGSDSTSALAQAVDGWAIQQIAFDYAAEHGIEPSDDDIAAATTRLTEQFGLEPTERQARYEAIRGLIGEQIAEDEGLLDLSDEALRELFETQLDSVLCFNQIVTVGDPAFLSNPGLSVDPEQVAEAEDRIEALADRIDQGEDFVDVAEEASEYQGPVAACQPPANLGVDLAAKLEALEVGEYDSEPYDLGAGFVLFQRMEPAFEDVRANVEEAARQQGEQAAELRVAEVLSEHAATLEVVIDPRIGTWNAEEARVEVPSGPLPNPFAQPATPDTLDLSQLDISQAPAGS